MVFEILFGMGLLSLGWLALQGATIQYRSQKLIEDTPTEKVRSIALGLTEVKGRIEPFEDALASPFSNTDCVAYVYNVERYYRTDDGDDGWSTEEIGVKLSKFYVNDGTGRVLVDPSKAEIDYQENSYTFSEGESDPEKIRSFLETRADHVENHRSGTGLKTLAEVAVNVEDMRAGDADDLIESQRRRRYSEAYLSVDEEVYVLGQAVPREGVSSPNNPENIVIQYDEDLPTYRISTRSEADLVSDTGTNVTAGIAFGALIALVGFGILLWTAGPILGLVLSPFSIGLAVLFNRRYGRDTFGTTDA